LWKISLLHFKSDLIFFSLWGKKNYLRHRDKQTRLPLIQESIISLPTITVEMWNRISSFAYIFFSFLPMACSSSPSSFECPPTPATVHAKCAMTVQFDQSCDVVRTELIARLGAENNWVDPHNQGTYTLSEGSSDSNRLEASRLTGNKLYTDKLAFGFTDSSSPSGCAVSACSVSQVTSVLDMSTNYCNLRNLYCNSKQDGCPVVHHELTYKETYQNCWQRNASKCIAVREKMKDL
jgi:hypothetical protein